MKIFRESALGYKLRKSEDFPIPGIKKRATLSDCSVSLSVIYCCLPASGRLFLRMEVIAMTVLEVLTLLELICVIVFGILGYIKK